MAVRLPQTDILGAKMLGELWGSCSQAKPLGIIWWELRSKSGEGFLAGVLWPPAIP